ncbi:hypothetical protein [Promineifilum sp.]|uniref:hypothetical protein n=1 Tax=Promineifilum sp. TaxID=2664178 RepID=UPI0035B19620
MSEMMGGEMGDFGGMDAGSDFGGDMGDMGDVGDVGDAPAEMEPPVDASPSDAGTLDAEATGAGASDAGAGWGEGNLLDERGAAWDGLPGEADGVAAGMDEPAGDPLDEAGGAEDGWPAAVEAPEGDPLDEAAEDQAAAEAEAQAHAEAEAQAAEEQAAEEAAAAHAEAEAAEAEAAVQAEAEAAEEQAAAEAEARAAEEQAAEEAAAQAEAEAAEEQAAAEAEKAAQVEAEAQAAAEQMAAEEAKTAEEAKAAEAEKKAAEDEAAQPKVYSDPRHAKGAELEDAYGNYLESNEDLDALPRHGSVTTPGFDAVYYDKVNDQVVVVEEKNYGSEGRAGYVSDISAWEKDHWSKNVTDTAKAIEASDLDEATKDKMTAALYDGSVVKELVIGKDTRVSNENLDAKGVGRLVHFDAGAASLLKVDERAKS